MAEWVLRNDDGTESAPITDAEWKRRYAACLMERGGMSDRPAIACAEDAYRMAVEDYSANMGDGLIDPEEAADEEMSNWENDGDDQ